MVNVLPVPGYPLLLASIDGDIYRKPYELNNKRGITRLGLKKLTPTKFTTSKYYSVKVKVGHRQYRRVSVHRLVALAWHDNYYNKPQVNHKDGNPTNNSAANLEWVTQSENHKHAFRTGLRKTRRGESAPRAKLTYEKADKIRALYKTGSFTQKQLGEIYGVNQTQIWKVVTNQRYVRDIAFTIFKSD